MVLILVMLKDEEKHENRHTKDLYNSDFECGC